MNASNDNAGTQERRTLWIVLLLNAAIAAGFFVSGAFADSSALIANGVDNLSDTAVYALSLVALTHGKTWKTRAAIASGVMLLIFAGGILIAGVLVLWLGTNWPDLLVGFATAIIAIKGGVEILRDARAETKKSERRSS